MKTYNITRTIVNGELVNKVILYSNLTKDAASKKFAELKNRFRSYADLDGYEGAFQFGFSKIVTDNICEEVDFYLAPSNVFI